MLETEHNKDTAAVTRVLSAYHAAMVNARTDDLAHMVAGDFTLTHITGYVQPKDEWFGVVRTRAFDYHAINVDAKTLVITPKGNSALVTGRGIFNATINGMKAPWRLEFNMQFVKRDREWIVARARYTSF